MTFMFLSLLSTNKKDLAFANRDSVNCPLLFALSMSCKHAPQIPPAARPTVYERLMQSWELSFDKAFKITKEFANLNVYR